MTEVQSTTIPSTSALSEAESLEDLRNLMRASYGDVVDIVKVAGDGFTPLDDKSKLVEVPFIIVTAELHKSDAYDEVAVLRVVTQDNKRYKIRDTSTGIRDQIKTLKRAGNILCEHGLRVSNYTFKNDAGKEQSATTYYIAM